MTSGIDGGTEQVRQANELYWSSDESVNRIADRLGLSKGSLYAAIKPKPSDSMCPTCGDQLVYANRTAREKNTLSCPKCTHEFTVRPDRTKVLKPRAADVPPIAAEPPSAPNRTVRARSEAAHGSPASGQLVLGTTLIALGTGLLLSRLVRRG